MLGACDEVTGGAVELSWKFRPASSALEKKFVECKLESDNTSRFTRIRLDWTVETEVNGVVEQHVDAEEWSCSDSRGVTGFDLPEGSALFAISPVCVDGPAEATSYIAPPVEQRRVIAGDTVNLGAIELVVQVSDCEDQPCICQ